MPEPASFHYTLAIAIETFRTYTANNHPIGHEVTGRAYLRSRGATLLVQSMDML